jgi:hypothetical protein
LKTRLGLDQTQSGIVTVPFSLSRYSRSHLSRSQCSANFGCFSDLIPAVMKDQHMQKEEREKEERLKTK